MDQVKSEPDAEGQSHTHKSLLDSSDPHCHLFANMRYGYVYCQVVVDKDGSPVDFIHREVNKSYETLTGLANVIGRKATEVFPDIRTSNPGFIERHLKVAETGVPDQFELHLAQLNKWFDISLYSHQKDFFSALLDDITERKKAEESLMRNEARFKTLFHSHSAIQALLDPATGKVLDVNQAAANWYGWSIEELRQMYTKDINTLPPEAIISSLKTVVDDQHNKFIGQHRRADGSVRDVEIFRSTIELDGKTVVHVITHDITERKEVEEALRKSERNFRSITEQIAEVVFLADPQGTLTYVSPVIEKLFGYQPHEVIGHLFTDYLAKNIVPEAEALFSNILLNQDINKSYEVKFKRKNASLFDGEINLQYYQDQEFSGLIGLIRDISDRKLQEKIRNEYEQEILQSRTFLQSIYDDVNHSIFVVEVHPDGSYHYKGHNAQNEKLVGISSEAITGKTPYEVFSPQIAEAMTRNYDKCMREGKTIGFAESLTFQGKDMFWETILNPVRNENGRIFRIIGTSTNITERRLAEEQLQQSLSELIKAKDKAEESDRLKSAFLANISHEIRTPMNGILGFSQLLKEPHLSGEEQEEYINLIHQSGKRMLNLINDLIDISRIDAKEATVQITETNVNPIMDDLQAFFKPQAMKKGLRLSMTKGLADCDSIIETDSEKLNQILINIIQNAIKFTAKGGIDFGYVQKEGSLEFYCIDSGFGIAVDKKEKIFERFNQVNTSLTRAHEGSGLGLSISKAFVELLGGSIRVESVEGGGSNFSFTLPYKQRASSQSSFSSVMTEAVDAPPPLCILLAEDDSVSTILFKKSLRNENISILCAENGWEAVELVYHHPEINLVLMDLKMPIMSGFEATRLIKEHRPDLPVIAQSAFTSIEDRQKAKEAGCDSFLTKPISQSDLLNKIQTLLLSGKGRHQRGTV